MYRGTHVVARVTTTGIVYTACVCLSVYVWNYFNRVDPSAALLIFEGGLHTKVKDTGNGWDSSIYGISLKSGFAIPIPYPLHCPILMRKEIVSVILFKIIRSKLYCYKHRVEVEVGRYFNIVIFTITIYHSHFNIYQDSNTFIMHSKTPCQISDYSVLQVTSFHRNDLA